MSLQYLFAQNDYIDGIDKKTPIIIHPIKLLAYNKFQDCSKLLYVSKNHFADTNYSLLELLFLARESLEISYEDLINKLCQLFSLVTHKEVIFVTDKYEGFLIDNINLIHVNNYDAIREIIMKQNLMFEQKVFKNKKVQEWANKVIEAKTKNQPKIGMEEIITTVSTFTGKHYWDLQNYTIYQIYSDFYRIRKMKSYDTTTMAKSHGADIEIDDFAEDLDIYKNPYDSLFVSKNKLSNLNKALGEQK
jgi:hypothetical protein